MKANILSRFMSYQSRTSSASRTRVAGPKPTVEALEERTLLDHGLCALMPHADTFWQVPAGFTTTGSLDGSGGAAKWSQPGGLGSTVTITYSYSNLLNGGMSGLTTAQMRSAIEEALAVWADYAPLRFVEAVDAGPSPTSSEGDYSVAGVPMLRFGHHYIDGDGTANALAHAYYPGRTGLAGDVHFDDGNSWTIGLFLETAVHEIGHTLGLGHEDSANAIMNGYLAGRYSGLGTAYLLQDDIDGIRYLYGSGDGIVLPLGGAKPGTPVLSAPTGTLTFARPTFSWSAATDATHYELWVNDLGSGKNVLYQGTLTATTYTPAAPLPAGNYRFWVRAHNGGTPGDWSAALDFSVTPTVPGSVSVLTPTGTTSDVTPTFTWSAATSATHYEVWVNNVGTGENVIYSDAVGGTSFTASTSLTAGTYRVWVRAHNGSAAGAWSAAHDFAVAVTTPGTVTLLGPIGAISDATPRFAWNAATDATHYELWVNNLTTNQNVLYRSNLTGTAYTPLSPLPAGSYRFWVRAHHDETPGAWSAALDFTIGAATPGTVALLSPASTTSDRTPTFSWTSAANATRYEVWVGDATTGQRVLYSATVSGTSHTFFSRLASGSYRVWVRAHNDFAAGAWSLARDFVII